MTERRGILVVVSGFAGAGKGTIMKKLVSEYDRYALSISMTTRSPRPGEVDGREYFFISKEQFEQNIRDGLLIEHALYCDNYYGTPRRYVEQQLDAGKDVILEIEIQGALQIKKRFPEALLLFVTPPSAEELQRRLIGRGTETPEVIAKRMRRAGEESEGIEQYDYIVINDDADRATEETHRIIQCAKNAPLRNNDFINLIRNQLKALAKGE
ncbi:MAG: guanylate kinase [Lachnospiraceae bacterium]|jgi:guanylate kinase|nr:guanylate kinase [Lachnospiraceae bacterium]